MRINLFTLIEDLFEGTLHFFYNFLASAATILAHPLDGPQRLADARKALAAEAEQKKSAAGAAEPEPRAGRSQIGGVTFLFVCFFLVYLASDLLPGGTLRPEVLLGIFDSPGSIGVGPIWPSIVGALAAAAVADMLLRPLILVRGEMARPALGRDARDDMIAQAEYALLWPLLAFTAVTALLAFVLTLYGEPFPDWAIPAMLGLLLAALASYLPAALQIWPAPGRSGGKARDRIGALLGAIGLLAGVMAAALKAGLEVSTAVHQAPPGPAAAAPAPAPAAPAAPPRG